ncbi:MAG TPA: FliM/FliN family flagellar motor switch protein [Terriglobales bacterium]|nr:FliM/FliN family flagellar motor switch protein [Terriglobales bacterium]
MEKLLDQEQINAMVRAARGTEKPKPVESQAVVSEYDLRHSTHLTKEQVRAVTSLHETVSRNLTHSMSAYLRVGFEATVVSVEQLAYAEFLGRLPDVTYLCSLNVAPTNSTAVLQLDLQLGYPIIDLLLGGSGSPMEELREATEIEEELIEGIVRLVARELAGAWVTAGFDISFDERQLPAAAQRLMRPSEKTLVVSFELRIPQARGMLNVAFPAAVANLLLRKMLREIAPKARAQAAPDAMIRNLLLDCEFDVRLDIPQMRLPLRQLAKMAPGTILTFDHLLGDEVTLSAGNIQLFCARPVRTERRRGAQLCGRLKKITEGGESGER